VINPPTLAKTAFEGGFLNIANRRNLPII